MFKRRLFTLGLCMLFLSAEAFAQMTTTALLDTIQHTAFDFFWNEANPSNGLIKDRSRAGVPSSIASVGFGLSAICIGVDHGWVTRAVARDRVLTTLRTFRNAPQGDGNSYAGNFGLFYHFLDMTTGLRAWDSELSTIDTALLLAGIVDARQYFDGSDSSEVTIRAYADSIYRRMNWNLMRNYHQGILMGYMPGSGFANYGQWIGYSEASIMYILAMGAPARAVDSTGWIAWTSGYKWVNYYGYQYVGFAPLFGHQYSHCWIDFRGIRDAYMRSKGIDYFENSRRATYAQRAYAVDNPLHHTGYSDTLWGFTASDVPTGYAAHGAPPPENDDGTIVPTAPVSSIAFAPEIVLPVIWNMWNNYRTQLWTKYGFRDAFNLDSNWWDSDIIGIDQGPMIIMIENYRTGRVWERFMRSPYVQQGLQVAGFVTVTSVPEENNHPGKFELLQNYPNPFNPVTVINYTVGQGQDLGTMGLGEEGRNVSVQLVVYDVLGREVKTLVNEHQAPGRYTVRFDGAGLSSGVYFYRLTAGSFTEARRMMLVK